MYGLAAAHQAAGGGAAVLGGGPESQGVQQGRPSNARQAAGAQVQAATMAPALNRYIQDKFPKDYKGSGVYGELSKQLEDFLAQGEKGTRLTYKYIVKTAAARLAQYEYLPPTLLRLLVGFFYSEDKKLVRTAFYLAQRMLGPGAGGTPIPAPPGNELFLASAELRKAELAKAWQDVSRPEANPIMRDFQLKLLAAAARVHPDVVSLLADAVKGMLLDCGIDPKAKKGASAAQPRVDPGARAVLVKSALMATRAALPSKPSTFTLVAKRAFHAADSPNALAARHALALMAQQSVTDAAVVERDLRVNVQVACKRYDTMKTFDSGTALKQNQALGINLDDAFARVYLARICGNVIQVERKDSEGAFFRMLSALVIKDPSDMVALEAIRSMAGHTVAPRPTLDMDIIHPHADAQALKRAKAWTVLVKQTSPPKPKAGEPAPSAPKLVGLIGARIKRALQVSHKKPTLVCGACRAVAALAEARARATAGQQPGDRTRGAAAAGPLDNMMDVLRVEMLTVLEGNHGPSERSLALTALLWMQKPGSPPVITPERIYASITVGGTGPRGGGHPGGLDPWPRESLQPVMHSLVQAARAVPALIQYRIECAMALVHGAPGRVSSDALVDLWRLAAQGSKQEARSTAVASALALLNSTPPPVTSATSGSSGPEVVRAAAEGTAWVRLQKLAAWWLGENLNQVAGEWTGQAPKPRADADDDASKEEKKKKKKKKEGGEEEGEEQGGAAPEKKPVGPPAVSNAEALMAEAGRSPVMVTVLDALQRALVQGAWPVRVAAAEAMGKVAVRSPEPYRLQCYAVLTALTKPQQQQGFGGTSGLSRDVLGVLSVARPLLGALDWLYIGQIEAEHMAQTHGMEAVEWPDGELEALRAKHEAAVRAAECVVGRLPVAAGYPLGPTSRALLTTDVEEERKLKEEEELKKNPDKWKAADASDSDSELDDREPAPWDRPGYGTAGGSSAPWDADREPAPWERDSRPPWERDTQDEEGAGEAPWETARRERPPWEKPAAAESDEESDAEGYGAGARRGGNPWEAAAPAEESSALPWERREPAPWEKYNTPAESSDEEEAHTGYGGGGGYDDTLATTHVKDEFWDSFGAGATTTLTPSSSFGAGFGAGASSIAGYDDGGYKPVASSAYDDSVGGYGYTTPELSDDDQQQRQQQPPAQPTGSGIVVHEFDAEGDEELTVVVGDEVDVFEETGGWLLCRASDGRMGLVPATYIQVGAKAGAGKGKEAGKGHRREPTLSDNPWEADEQPGAGGAVDGSEPSFAGGVSAAAGKAPGHKREPTFEFEEGSGGPGQGAAVATSSSFKFESSPIAGEDLRQRATALYGFDAEEVEELTVAPGDDLILHKESDGWYTATRVADGTRGLVPASYVQLS